MKKYRREMVLGVLILAIGIFYFIMTLQVPGRGGVDARFVPFLLSGALFLLGTLQLISTFRSKKQMEKAEEESTEAPEKIDTGTVIKTIALIILYIALLNKIGFVIMSALYLFIQFIILTPINKKKNYVLYTIIAVVSSVSIFLIFRYVFDLMLPAGLLG